MGQCKQSIQGFGINDSSYRTQPYVNGKRTICPYYAAWKGMIERCYSATYLKKHPSYIGCSVAEEWRFFSAFKAWMEGQDWVGKCLDKDILYPGNKVYGPDTCVFVTSKVNNIILNRGRDRGKYPCGVYYLKSARKYKAQINTDKLRTGLGYYDTPEEASKVYRSAKRKQILALACCDPNILVKQGLYRHAKLLE